MSQTEATSKCSPQAMGMVATVQPAAHHVATGSKSKVKDATAIDTNSVEASDSAEELRKSAILTVNKEDSVQHTAHSLAPATVQPAVYYQDWLENSNEEPAEHSDVKPSIPSQPAGDIQVTENIAVQIEGNIQITEYTAVQQYGRRQSIH